MINDLRISVLVMMPMMSMIMAMLMNVMMLLMLLSIKLFFGCRFEPSLINFHINCVLRAASVAFPDMMLMKCYSVKWLPGKILPKPLATSIACKSLACAQTQPRLA